MKTFSRKWKIVNFGIFLIAYIVPFAIIIIVAGIKCHKNRFGQIAATL
jgi:hypothetical protein